MGLLQTLGLRKQSSTTDNLSLIPPWKRYQFAPFDGMTDVVEKAYKKNATVFACMWILQSMFPEPELWSWEREDRISYKPIQGHAVRKLFSKPNQDMSEVEFLQFVITYAPLGGNVYIWKQRDKARRVKNLWPFHDGHITPIRSANTREGFVAYYVLNDGSNEQTNPWGLERVDLLPGVAIPKSEIIHWKWMIDPLNPERGMGALEASAGDVLLANELRDYIYTFLKNDAKPPIVVTMAEGDEFTPAKAKRLKEQWLESTGGANRGTPSFLEFGMVVKELSSSLRDMQFGDLGDRPDASICMGFHINPVVVGALVGLKNSTYSNFEEANKALALQTMVPLWRSFESELQQGLSGEIGFSEEESLRFDRSQVTALQESEKEKEERIGSGFDRGGVTRAEYRRSLGLEVSEADDVYKENLASIWVPRGVVRQNDPDLLDAEEDRQSGEDEEGKGKKETKSASQSREIGNVLMAIRNGLIGKMRDELKEYSSRLAGEVVQRLLASGKGKRGKKELSADDLILESDVIALSILVKRFYVSVLELSWDTWNISLGVELAFDLTDPLVTEILGMAGERVKDITEETMGQLQEALQYGSEQGWSIEQLAAGDPEAGIPGIQDLIEESYKNRSKNIARTELGMAQNTAAINRYSDAGVSKVLILDDGFPRSDENCVWIDGQTRSLEWTKEDHPDEGPSGIKNPLQHPGCVRCFAPKFDEE